MTQSNTTQGALDQLIAERREVFEQQMQPLRDLAATRSLTDEERQSFDRIDTELTQRTARIEQVRRALEQERAFAGTPAAGMLVAGAGSDVPAWRNLDTGERAAVLAGESIRQHPVFERALQSRDAAGAAQANYGSLGAMVRALAVGGTGSALVPTAWAGELIDLARSESAVSLAQATIVPMEAGTVKIGRQTGDPTVGFRAENDSVGLSQPTFDSVTLEAKTLSAIVTASIEWWQDVENSDQLVVNALARAIAAKIDEVALYGGITEGAGTIDLPSPPNPRGVLATMLAQRAQNVLGTAAANGTTPSVAAGFWNEILDAVYTVRDANESPTAVVWSSKLERQYARAVDTTGQPLGVPTALADVPRLRVNRVPSYTKGTLNRATDAFVGDFRQLLIGQRLGLTLQPLNELYAAEGKYGVLATWRGDVALARTGAFSVYRALAGAA
ncbi:phage major capsid protein [Microbacterium sp. IEGM 1404]|uniref:phage major capsid protein n=1 Tax=Microbacterium sp. IEGM 1404 TaxID=3047084 RepID=UPI0024B73E1C|nr:phage major capsid protein [Microbacterium sp. IEGM 1404]MDI9891934.1 phage major capsid protein [Microbacterium sp. IEGM 1404]